MITDSARERERRRIELRLAELEMNGRRWSRHGKRSMSRQLNGNPTRTSVTQQTLQHRRSFEFCEYAQMC